MHKRLSTRTTITLLFLIAMFSGCGDWAVRDYPHPSSVVLQEPAPGQALIYFLRAPHDNVSLEILSNGRRLVKMPAETYVALHLPPAQYRFVTTSSGLFHGDGQIAEPLEITLKAGQRVFYHVSGIDEKSVGLIGVMSVKGAGAVPLLGREEVVRNRIWKECTELDARGLITISRPVQPEP